MNYKTVDAHTLRQWLLNKEVYLVDVREIPEYAEHHIENSHLLPLSSFQPEQVMKFSGKKIVVHCHLGGRSSTACKKIISANPALDVYNLEGGISAWMQAGYPVKQVKKRVFSIFQQSRLIIGSIIVLGTVLGYAANTYFLWIPALIGIGLLINAVTGFCHLERFLARMPWNKKIASNGHSCAIK